MKQGEEERAQAASRKRRSLFSGGVLTAMGQRDFRLLWTGAFISNVGTWIQMAALLWYVKERTGSNAWVGAVNLANFIPVLLLVLYAGSLADRHDRKKLILYNQVLMMLSAFALALLCAFGHPPMWSIMLAVFVSGVAFALNFPAWQSVLPDLVREDEILNAVALSSAQFNLARFIGPFLGAALVGAWSASGAFIVNGVSFLFIIFAVMMVKTETPPYPPPPEGTIRHITAAFRYVAENRWVLYIIVGAGVSTFFGFSYVVLLPGVAKDVLHRSEYAYGVLLGMTGLGAVIAAPLVTMLSRHFKERDIIKATTASLGASLVAFSFSRTFWLSCVLGFWVGLSFLAMNSSMNSVIQARTGREMRGRVISIYIMATIGVFPIGGQVMGAVADAAGVPFAVLLCGIVCLAAALAYLLFPSLIRDAYSVPGK